MPETSHPKPISTSFIEWKDWYSVGNQEMDVHHRTILDMINRLYIAIQTGGEKKILEEIFQQLFDYAKYHFAREEALMVAYVFPGCRLHRKKHVIFTKKLDHFYQEFHKSGGISGKELFAFLKQWWLNHICTEDKKYANTPTATVVPEKWGREKSLLALWESEQWVYLLDYYDEPQESPEHAGKNK